FTSPRPPGPTLFPYTTLFRSRRGPVRGTMGALLLPRPCARGTPALTRLCETCGFPLPPDAHFCPNCGASVSALETAGERRLVTVDRKSTRLNSSHVAISYAVF